MSRFLLSTFLFLHCLALMAQQPRVKKTVFIIVDGIPADVIEKLDPPHFKKIAAAGGFARSRVGGEKGGYSETPTISAVGYNSVLTGTWVNKHNVWDNDITAPNYHYPTIFRLLKTQFPGKKTGIFSSWLDNRTKLVGDNKMETGNLPVDYKFDGLEYDTINYPQDKKRDFMHRIDEAVANKAAETIRTAAPDLSWVYLEYTDDMAHAYGDSPEFYKAVGYADAQAGRIWDAVEYRQNNFNEDWLFIVTTDHGRDSISGHNHGGQSNREKSGWILTNAKGLNEHFRNNESSMVDIMPTIAKFMDITIPLETAREIDGVPLTGKLSLTDPVIDYNDKKATLRWKAKGKKGRANIWVSTTNHFKTGGKDEYRLVKQVRLRSQKAVIDLDEFPSSGFYKIVVEGENNLAGRWIITK